MQNARNIFKTILTNGCTPHNICKRMVSEIVLTAIKSVTEQVKEHKKDFIQAATQNSDKEISKEKVRIERVLSKAQSEKIVIHERSEPHKRKGYTQKVDIYFNFISKLGDS